MVQKLTGLVLRTTEYKESDLILNILTREQGLISAKARAVRTNRSHNKGACQLLCYSEFTITDYKGFSAISEANAIEMFPELRTDIELLSLASYFAQAAEVLSQEDAGQRRGAVANAERTVCAGEAPQTAGSGQGGV